MMCLKKFVKYTFSNREAWDRITKIVEEDYSKYVPEGEIYVIREYREWGVKTVKDRRNTLSYDNLMGEIENFYPPFKHWDYYSFLTWDEWRQTREDVGDIQDVFGYVELELQ